MIQDDKLGLMLNNLNFSPLPLRDIYVDTENVDKKSFKFQYVSIISSCDLSLLEKQ